jgi:hypothetical protein
LGKAEGWNSPSCPFAGADSVQTRTRMEKERRWHPVGVCGWIRAPCTGWEGDSVSPPAPCIWRDGVGDGSCCHASAGPESSSPPVHGAIDDTEPQSRPMHRAWIGTETPCHIMHPARYGPDTPALSMHSANHDTEPPSRLVHGAIDGLQQETGHFRGFSDQKDTPPGRNTWRT